jgi:SAM-dependent methyltransferase
VTLASVGVQVPRLGVRTRMRASVQRLVDVRHRVGLRRLGAVDRPEYRRYLDVQLRRTLGKRANDPGIGLRILIDETISRGRLEPDARVLCVGCRNGVELDEFRARGFEDVVGIDLFSQRPDILVMDMHRMTFPDGSFDVVFASHALEHSYDLATVVGEIGRVARDGGVVALEVPVGGRASEADRIEFSGVDQLREAFGPNLGEELWADEQPPRTATNDQGTDVARLVFRLSRR